MQSSIQNETPLDPMDIARVARLLWRQAGSKPGCYAEYWTRVEQALACAQYSREMESLIDQDSLTSQRKGPSDSAGVSEESGSTQKEQTASGLSIALAVNGAKLGVAPTPG
jgi:hypothetical protein